MKNLENNFWKIFLAHKTLFFVVGLFSYVVAFIVLLLFPITYKTEGLYFHGSNAKNVNLMTPLSTILNEKNEFIVLSRSYRILSDVVKNVNGQVHIRDKSFFKRLKKRALRNISAQMRHLETLDSSFDADLIKCDIPECKRYDLKILSKKKAIILSRDRKIQKQVQINECIILPGIELLFKKSFPAKENGYFELVFIPLEESVEKLKKRLLLYPNKKNPSYVTVGFYGDNPVFNTLIVNEVMNTFERYQRLIKSFQKEKELSYLESKKQELLGSFFSEIQNESKNHQISLREKVKNNQEKIFLLEKELEEKKLLKMVLKQNQFDLSPNLSKGIMFLDTIKELEKKKKLLAKDLSDEAIEKNISKYRFSPSVYENEILKLQLEQKNLLVALQSVQQAQEEFAASYTLREDLRIEKLLASYEELNEKAYQNYYSEEEKSLFSEKINFIKDDLKKYLFIKEKHLHKLLQQKDQQIQEGKKALYNSLELSLEKNNQLLKSWKNKKDHFIDQQIKETERILVDLQQADFSKEFELEEKKQVIKELLTKQYQHVEETYMFKDMKYQMESKESKAIDEAVSMHLPQKPYLFSYSLIGSFIGILFCLLLLL